MISDGVVNVLDISNPGAYEFLKKRYQWVRSMDYDMAMMDFKIYGQYNRNAGDRFKYNNLSTYEGIRKA